MLALLLAIGTPGCGGGGGDGDGGGSGGGGGGGAPPPPSERLSDAQLRLQFIRTIGNGFILPTYTAMEAKASDLITAAEAFCANPNASSLNAAQAQWRQVAGLWMESELVKFGPARQDFVHDNIDIPRGGHANANGIEARITGTDDIDPAFARRLPVNQRGLEGIEYLLFGDVDENAAILDAYSGAPGGRRCDYLEAIVVNLYANIDVILTRWQADGDNYVGAWNSAGEAGNTTYPSVQSAVDDLMNEMEAVIDDLVNVKLQQANWVQRKPESWRSRNSLANVRHRIEATEMIYLGIDRDTDEDGFGLDDYLRRTGKADLDTQIRTQFGVALAALDAIPGTLADAVVDDLALVDDAEAKSRLLLRLLKRELAVHLDVFFGFNDADGD